MTLNINEIKCFEQQFIELVSEFQTLSISESQLREALRTQAGRAEAAEASKDAVERAGADARAGAIAASAGATQAGKALAAVQDELVTVKMQLEFANRQRSLYEEKCSEMTNKITSLERELQNLRPLQATNLNIQRQYTELRERVQSAIEKAQREVSRLENELRRVEKSASAGSELRERARLAAAVHAREKRLADAEIQHTARELQAANAEIMRQKSLITELEYRLSNLHEETSKKIVDPDIELLNETKAALETERNGVMQLKKALSAALKDNASLAAELHNIDNNDSKQLSSEYSTATNICPIDAFLAD